MSRYPLTLKPVESEETIHPHTTHRYAETLAKIEEISGTNVHKCMQCGCCSAGCPVSETMDYTPAQMLRLLQMGMLPEIAECSAILTCASCFACIARCPKGIDIAKVAEAVRQIHLRKGNEYQDPSKISDETLRRVPQIALISTLRKFSS